MVRLVPVSLPGTLLAIALITPAPRAQGGYTTDDFPELGLRLKRARDYVQVPVQPDEEWIVLYWGEQKKKARTKEEQRRLARLRPAELCVVWIDWYPDPQRDEGAPPPVALDGDGPTEHSGETLPPITTLERYVEQRLPGWTLLQGDPGRERDGYEGSVHRLRLDPEGSSRNRRAQAARMGWAYAYRSARRTIAFLGFCDEVEFDDQRRIWETMAESLRIEEPEATDLTKLTRYYERRSFAEPEYRINVRANLVRGWDAEDLDHYIVVDHITDEPLLRKIWRDIEAIRELYVELFPPTARIDAVSTVRVCKDRDEYIRYGGAARSAGYWNSVTEELVLFDAAKKVRGKRPKDDDTFIVLYHEAFHQYIHYASGELPPHSWFNEGYGDYFSGARIKGGRVRGIGPNPWRLRTIQWAIKTGQYVSWPKIIRYEQKDYYANAGVCYAQGWSMIYFLNEARVVRKHPEWRSILPTYFDTLKSAYAEELAALDEDERTNEGARAAAGQVAREAAVTAAFEEVDLSAIEVAWKEFVLELELD